jgi:hypothetical protein
MHHRTLMRGEAQKAKIEKFLSEMGRRVASPGRIYLTGGGSAVLIGWRDTTIDLDLKSLPEPDGFFPAIAGLKDELDINIELSAPDQFLPELRGWQDRSLFIVRHGWLDFFHYDFYSQALAKIERGHARDLRDVDAMLDRNLVERTTLWTLFTEIEEALVRFPAIEPRVLHDAVRAVCQAP